MTQELLVQVIFLLCNKTNDLNYAINKIKQDKVICMESFVNCAVGPNGKIMTLKEFTEKCSKK